MATTIQVSDDLQAQLSKKKLFLRETYEEVIWDLIEDSKELSESAKSELKIAREEIKSGKVHSFSSVKKELGL